MASARHVNTQLLTAHDAHRNDMRQADVLFHGSEVSEEEDGSRERGQGRFDPLPEDLSGPLRGYLPMQKGSVSIDKEIPDIELRKGAVHSQSSREGSLMQTRFLKLPDDRDAFSDAGSAGERESSEGGDGVATEMSFDLIRLQPNEGKVALPRLVIAMCCVAPIYDTFYRTFPTMQGLFQCK